jgi:tRNA A-37 threonylcarbamoyl transferase component Bud32
MGGRVQPGDVLDGKYAVERVVGQGGTGYVVAAQHLILRRRVALKFLRPELAAQPDLGRRFLLEGQAAAQMRGDHVARVLDADTLRTGEPYLAMEFLEGEDLAAVLRRCGHLPVSDATDYLIQACEAVREAHTLKVVHRDLKPANLFLTQGPGGKPCIKVLDFGLSKVLTPDKSSQTLTDSNLVIGSPHFMSPEQIRTPRDVDERTDIWSLGATLFAMLTGHVPYDGRSMIEVCGALLCGPAPRVRRLRADVPAELERVVLRCLRVEPADRYESVAALSRALAPFARENPETRPEQTQSAPDWANAGARTTGSRVGILRGDTQPSRRLAVVIGVIGLLALATAWGWERRAKRPASSFAPMVEPPLGATTVLADAPSPAPSAPPDSDPGVEWRALAFDHAAAASTPRKTRSLAGERMPHSAASSAGSSEARAGTTPPETSATERIPLAAPTGSDGMSPAMPGRDRDLLEEPPSCAAPFYIDGQGIKTFRPECM